MNFKTKAISVDASGRVMLDDAALAQIETHFTRSVGGSGTTNNTCDGLNNGCTNSVDCRGSTNTGTCANETRCARVFDKQQ